MLDRYYSPHVMALLTSLIRICLRSLRQLSATGTSSCNMNTQKMLDDRMKYSIVTQKPKAQAYYMLVRHCVIQYRIGFVLVCTDGYRAQLQSRRAYLCEFHGTAVARVAGSVCSTDAHSHNRLATVVNGAVIEQRTNAKGHILGSLAVVCINEGWWWGRSQGWRW